MTGLPCRVNFEPLAKHEMYGILGVLLKTKRAAPIRGGLILD
jgi:hypothetical protein